MQQLGEAIRGRFQGNFQQILDAWNALPDEEKERTRQRSMMDMSGRFVKMLVNKTSWKKEYAYGAYCFLGEEMGKIWAGFVIPFFGSLPGNVQDLSDEELRIYDEWARATNHYPQPFIKKEVKVP